MPNRKVHAQIGVVGGAATYLLMSKYYKREMEFEEFALCALVGLAAAALPDFLEPALAPNHRSVAHSVVVLLLVAAFLIWFIREKDGETKELGTMLIASAGVGYLTHLIADGCTPKGLPIFA